MNREILFRGKRVDYGEWVYGCLVNNVFFKAYTKIAIPYIFNPEHCDSADYFEDFTDDFGYYEVIPETIGQYTGLTDKNGVKIFEGDYLRDDYSDDDGNVIEGFVKVIWDNENAQWAIDNSFKQDGSSLTNLVYYLGLENLEVVNNG